MTCLVLPWYAKGVVSEVGADKADRDNVAMDIVNDNSSILHQSSVDVKIPPDRAYVIFLQSKFMRYTRLIALHKVLVCNQLYFCAIPKPKAYDSTPKRKKKKKRKSSSRPAPYGNAQSCRLFTYNALLDLPHPCLAQKIQYRARVPLI